MSRRVRDLLLKNRMLGVIITAWNILINVYKCEYSCNEIGKHGLELLPAGTECLTAPLFAVCSHPRVKGAHGILVASPLSPFCSVLVGQTVVDESFFSGGTSEPKCRVPCCGRS